MQYCEQCGRDSGLNVAYWEPTAWAVCSYCGKSKVCFGDSKEILKMQKEENDGCNNNDQNN